MTDNVLGPRTVGYWLHSGGVDPATGEPSFASKLRLYALIATLRSDAGKGYRQLVFLSGEPTRKSGGYDQATVMEQALQKDMVWPGVHVMNTSMAEAYRDIGRLYGGIDVLKFINDDVHMSRYLWQFAKADIALAAKVEEVSVKVSANPDYHKQYPLDYVAAYNTSAWLRETVKAVGLFQLFIFMVDRAVNKPTKNPLKKAVAFVANSLLRPDLR